jgi:phosphopantetheinyl transferase
MTICEVSPLASGAPTAYLIDARARGCGEKELRAEARALSARRGEPFSSRSYRYPYAVVACHHQRVGVDLEVVDAANIGLGEVICTPAERLALATVRDQQHYLSGLWSAKEALAKALGDALLYEPGRLTSPALWRAEPASTPCSRGPATVVTGRWRATALDVPDGYVGWLCWVA